MIINVILDVKAGKDSLPFIIFVTQNKEMNMRERFGTLCYLPCEFPFSSKEIISFYRWLILLDMPIVFPLYILSSVKKHNPYNKKYFL